MKKIFLVILTIFVIGGCVSHAPSLPEGYRGPIAFVQDSEHRIDQGKADLFYLHAIDGREIRNSRTRSRSASLYQGDVLTTVLQENQVQTGQRVLTLVGRTAYAMPARSWAGTVYEVKGEVRLTLIENGAYIIRGKLAEEGSIVWIEDQTTGEMLGSVEVEGPSKLNFFEK
ncbi:MAG: hypothetical protein AAF446_01240 [Pseudomonadota bacterium]